jgi:glutathione peroxidase
LQEPGTNEEIKTFAAGFGVTFPMFAKIDVNGPYQIPLYKWLKEVQGGTMGDGLK